MAETENKWDVNCMGVVRAITVHGDGLNMVFEEDEESVDYLVVMRKQVEGSLDRATK